MIFFFFQMNLNPYILSLGKFKLKNLVNVLSVLIFHVSIHSVRGKWKFDDLTEKFVKSRKRDSVFLKMATFIICFYGLFITLVLLIC